ncbi:hypothetical protein GCM10028775_40720 [Catellatospora paridis]
MCTGVIRRFEVSVRRGALRGVVPGCAGGLRPFYAPPGTTPLRLASGRGGQGEWEHSGGACLEELAGYYGHGPA